MGEKPLEQDSPFQELSLCPWNFVTSTQIAVNISGYQGFIYLHHALQISKVQLKVINKQVNLV